MPRLHRTTMNRRVKPVTVRARVTESVDGRSGARPRSGSVASGHKQVLLATLIERPEGVLLTDLAGAIGLGPDRTRTLLEELKCEGLVGWAGRAAERRWFAEV